MRFLRPVLLLLLCSAFLWPPPAAAGTYAVTTCFGPETGAWTEWEPSPFVAVYSACPGGAVDPATPGAGDGLTVRNSLGSGWAPTGAAGALTFDAPAGTSIAAVEFKARLVANPGWQVGLFDATHDRWAWCGTSCSTSGGDWVQSAVRGLATRRLQALVRCAAERCGRDRRRAVIGLRDVRVTLEDASPPSITGVRGSLASGDGAWLRGSADVAFDAGDNTGIRLARVELDGNVLADDLRACEASRAVPCADGPTRAAFDTRTWSDGEHVLRLGAQDASGNWSWVERKVRVDNTAPSEPAAESVGGERWSPAGARSLRLTGPGDQAAPLVRALVRICAASGSGPCREAAHPLRADGSVPVRIVDGPGEYRVRAAVEDAAGNVGAWSPPVALRFDDTVPGVPDLAGAERWRSGGELTLAAAGPPPLSGVHHFAVRMPGQGARLVATALPLTELAEGETPITVRAVSGAGVESAAARTVLRIDRSAPGVTAVGASDGWSQTPVRVMLNGSDQPTLSGVRSLAWRIDTGAEVLVDGHRASVHVESDGRHTLAFRAVDGAGNASEPGALIVKVDRTPPETVAFEAPDPADPQGIRVAVADRTSGIVAGEISLRRAGEPWRTLPTRLEGDRLVSRLDDARLGAGSYSLRAVATDAAGNEAVGRRRADDARAQLALPLRRRTSLRVRRVGDSLRARLSSGGRALGSQRLRLVQRLRGADRAWRPVCRPDCSLRTNAAGRLRVLIDRGPSRTLRLEFAGDLLLLPARGDVRLRTPARVVLGASPRRVRGGAAVRFTGRLRGRHVPRGGKLVELQAAVGSGWRTFATLRARRGRSIRYVHNFATASSGRVYRVRMRVPREAAYPFEAGVSAPVAVRVL